MSYQDEFAVKLEEKTAEIVAELPSFCRQFFSYLRSKGMSPRTRLQYAYDIRRFITFLSEQSCYAHVDLKTSTASDVLDPLTIEDIQEYLDTLEYNRKEDSSKVSLSSPSSKARKISSLRSFFKYYFRIGVIHKNIADLLDVPKIPDKAVVVMSKDHVERILSAVSSDEGLSESEARFHRKTLKRDFAIMMLFFGTGIRVSELSGANITDLDFVNETLKVTRKGGDEDLVYLGPEVVDALKDYIENGRNELLAGARDDALFISIQHKRMGTRSVEIMVKGYAAKAGINLRVTPHTLRRTFGTNLYEETGDIGLVADALHHSSMETTKKHYVRMSEEHKKIAAQKSSSLFKK